jgi:hypothetical protein
MSSCRHLAHSRRESPLASLHPLINPGIDGIGHQAQHLLCASARLLDGHIRVTAEFYPLRFAIDPPIGGKALGAVAGDADQKAANFIVVYLQALAWLRQRQCVKGLLVKLMIAAIALYPQTIDGSTLGLQDRYSYGNIDASVVKNNYTCNVLDESVIRQIKFDEDRSRSRYRG